MRSRPWRRRKAERQRFALNESAGASRRFFLRSSMRRVPGESPGMLAGAALSAGDARGGVAGPWSRSWRLKTQKKTAGKACCSV